MKFGAHVSIAGGLLNAPHNGVESGCDVIQVFTKNQMQWKVAELTEKAVAEFKQAEKDSGVKAVCVHASYLINLGGFEPYKLQRSRKNFIVEMERAEALGIPYLVVHPGSHMGKGEAEGLQKISDSLNYVFGQRPDFEVKVLLETTAGQGDNLGYEFEHLAKIKSKVERKEKIGVCVDTCHIFAAGYDFRTEETYEEMIKQLDGIIGIDQVGIMHTNDSLRELGSKRDRHAHIGEGDIGLEGFAHFMNDSRFENIPFILETPGGVNQDRANIQKLKDLIEG